MKKFALISFLALVALSAWAQKDEFTLPPIAKEFHGTWIPNLFIETFEDTANYARSLRAGDPPKRPHNILFVGTNSIGSDLGFHDSYAITAAEFASFELTKKSGKPIIFDGKGNSYTRIHPTASYDAYEAWLASSLKKRIDDPNPHPVLKADGSLFFFDYGMNKSLPYKLVLDLFHVRGPDGEASFYDFYLYNREQNTKLGLRFVGEDIEVWRILETATLKGQTWSDISIAEVLVFRLKRK